MDIIDDGNPAELPLKDEVKLRLQISDAEKNEIKSVFAKVIKNLNGKTGSLVWLNDDWIDATINSAPNKFDRTLDRCEDLQIRPASFERSHTDHRRWSIHPRLRTDEGSFAKSVAGHTAKRPSMQQGGHEKQ